MVKPREWVIRCPYCSAYPAPFQPVLGQFQTNGIDGGVRPWVPASCPACGGVVVAELNSDQTSIQEFQPQSVGEWDVGHLPPSIQTVWDEAVKVFSVGAHASAVVSCGRTLEAAADERQIAGRTLQNRIKTMRGDGLITTEFEQAMDYVRLIRNVGAHAGKEVSEESAEGTMRFTLQTLRLLFEVPGELARLTGHPPELGEGEDEDT